jgi:hypothetical protein
MPLKLHTIAFARLASHYFGFSFKGFPKLVWNWDACKFGKDSKICLANKFSSPIGKVLRKKALGIFRRDT